MTVFFRVENIFHVHVLTSCRYTHELCLSVHQNFLRCVKGALQIENEQDTYFELIDKNVKDIRSTINAIIVVIYKPLPKQPETHFLKRRRGDDPHQLRRNCFLEGSSFFISQFPHQ